MNPVEWFATKTLAELQQCLQQKTEKTAFLAGGTDFLVTERQALAKWQGIIDLSHLAALQEIHFSEAEVWLGAMMTYQQISEEPCLGQEFPALVEAAGLVGSQQIRNRGTIGGGLVNASPAGDLLPVWFALAAEVELLSASGEKSRLPISEFLLGARAVALQPKQCVLGIILPRHPRQSCHFAKLGVRSQVAIAQISAAATISCQEDDTGGRTIEAIRFYVGAIAPKPVPWVEEAVSYQGQPWAWLQEEDTKHALVAYYQRWILAHTPAEYDRDYKAQAVKAVVFEVLDSFTE